MDDYTRILNGTRQYFQRLPFVPGGVTATAAAGNTTTATREEPAPPQSPLHQPLAEGLGFSLKQIYSSPRNMKSISPLDLSVKTIRQSADSTSVENRPSVPSRYMADTASAVSVPVVPDRHTQQQPQQQQQPNNPSRESPQQIASSTTTNPPVHGREYEIGNYDYLRGYQQQQQQQRQPNQQQQPPPMHQPSPRQQQQQQQQQPQFNTQYLPPPPQMTHQQQQQPQQPHHTVPVAVPSPAARQSAYPAHAQTPTAPAPSQYATAPPLPYFYYQQQQQHYNSKYYDYYQQQRKSVEHQQQQPQQPRYQYPQHSPIQPPPQQQPQQPRAAPYPGSGYKNNTTNPPGVYPGQMDKGPPPGQPLPLSRGSVMQGQGQGQGHIPPGHGHTPHSPLLMKNNNYPPAGNTVPPPMASNSNSQHHGHAYQPNAFALKNPQPNPNVASVPPPILKIPQQQQIRYPTPPNPHHVPYGHMQAHNLPPPGHSHGQPLPSLPYGGYGGQVDPKTALTSQYASLPQYNPMAVTPKTTPPQSQPPKKETKKTQRKNVLNLLRSSLETRIEKNNKEKIFQFNHQTWNFNEKSSPTRIKTKAEKKETLFPNLLKSVTAASAGTTATTTSDVFDFRDEDNGTTATLKTPPKIKTPKPRSRKSSFCGSGSGGRDGSSLAGYPPIPYALPPTPPPTATVAAAAKANSVIDMDTFSTLLDDFTNDLVNNPKNTKSKWNGTRREVRKVVKVKPPESEEEESFSVEKNVEGTSGSSVGSSGTETSDEEQDSDDSEEQHSSGSSDKSVELNLRRRTIVKSNKKGSSKTTRRGGKEGKAGGRKLRPRRNGKQVEDRDEGSSSSGEEWHTATTKPIQPRRKLTRKSKIIYGDGSDFYRPGIEKELIDFKKKLRMPNKLINISSTKKSNTIQDSDSGSGSEDKKPRGRESGKKRRRSARGYSSSGSEPPEDEEKNKESSKKVRKRIKRISSSEEDKETPPPPTKKTPIKKETPIQIPNIKQVEKPTLKSVFGVTPKEIEKKRRPTPRRNKFKSGFDYIRKKKKAGGVTGEVKPKKVVILPKELPRTIADIQNEIKQWVLNKGLGETILHRACKLGLPDITSFILDKGMQGVNSKDNAGYTPLHECCIKGYLDISKILLSYGASVNSVGPGGMRPLHEACENGYIELVRLLLSYGADPCLSTYAGQTPSDLSENYPLIQTLLKQHMNDIEGLDDDFWEFSNSGFGYDTTAIGYDCLEGFPTEENEEDGDDESGFEFEASFGVLPPLYILKEVPSKKYVLLTDVLHYISTSKETFLKQNPKLELIELNSNDFLEDTQCQHLLGEKFNLNSGSEHLILVKYECVKKFFNIESCFIK